MALKNLVAKWPGKCAYCAMGFSAGQKVAWDSNTKKVYHPSCSTTVQQKITEAQAQAAGMPVVGQGASLKPGVKPKLQPTGGWAPVPYVATVSAPKTQKGKGIVVLQEAGLLGKSMAKVATTIEEARAYYEQLAAAGKKPFMRGCPTFARHGFVDSRQVGSLAEVEQVWAECKAEDAQAEAVLMPFIDATHNMVWTPGLLSIGPKHDGATAGTDSVSVFLEPKYGSYWKQLAVKAGVRLQAGDDPVKEPAQDPYVEAVSSYADPMVITQIRAGAAQAPTAPDWNTHDGMIVAKVVTIDQEKKKEPGYMLEWEGIAKALVPGSDVVFNPGGNLVDHFSVHARLHNITVITSFVPQVGQTLPKMGVELVPLEPQAVIWGALAGLLMPGLKESQIARRRAVCAAILGGHHGLAQGGDAGVFLGISIGLLLRLSQAILWGEARHAEKKGISRDQVYKNVLDSWETGRAKLRDKIGLFHTHNWPGAFGGKAWAAIGHACVALDKTLLDLMKTPSQIYVKEAVGKLVTAVNVCHNTGWAFNKFIESSWFDLCADADPRAALMAGPIWYDAAVWQQSHGDEMIALLDRIEKMQPIDLHGFKPVTAKVYKSKGKGKTTGEKLAAAADVLAELQNVGAVLQQATVETKLGGFMSTICGGSIQLGAVGKVVGAQAKAEGDGLHCQIKIDTGGGVEGYYSGQVHAVGADVLHKVAAGPMVPSMAGSGVAYFQLAVSGEDRWALTPVGSTESIAIVHTA